MNEYSFSCRFCADHFPQLKQYLWHLKHHRHVTQTFPCGVVNCSDVLSSEGSLRNHLLRRHGLRVSLLSDRLRNNVLNANARIICNVLSCRQEVDSIKNIMSHLGAHISAGCLVKCPYPSCLKKYSVFSSLRGHVSRSHRDMDYVMQCEPDVDDHPDNDFSDQPENDVDVSLKTLSPQNHELWLRSMSEFFMSLEFKHLIPRSTVQKISAEILNVHRNAMSAVWAVMDDESMTHDEKYKILKDIMAQFESGFSDMRSSHMRNNFFKSHFLYVTPQKISLGGGKFFYYIPIEETLKKMMASKCLDIHLDAPTCSERNVYSDFYDGLLYKTNPFFRENRKAFSLILYQDGFEICCPIGPAKTKYKMIGIYLTLGNMPSHVRTHVDSIQLVGLCLESSFDHSKVYGTIVEDLKKIELNGCEIPGHGTVKGSLVYISGDNLGSHGLGGFNENFSKSIYFCRYCLVDRRSFFADGGHLSEFQARNKVNYSEAVQGRNIASRKGIKFNSKFNELKNFHVCDPGLPPCVGHDVLEGVAAHDVILYFRYFVETKEWFTCERLTEIMSSFPYSEKDRKDKPLPPTLESEKIKGGMWQVYNFVRLVPLMIHGLIKDTDDPVWKLFLLIGEILDILAAPVIHKSYLGHLQCQIVEYLDRRRSLFPDVPLRPKHHYMTHFCQMIFMFGPLGKVWTLRFESKHCFFKNAIRASKNFCNVMFSCSSRHEMFQAYIRAGGGVRCPLKIHKGSPFDANVYCPEIKAAVQKIFSNRLTQSFKCEIKGTVYSKGALLALYQTVYEADVTFGRIIFILVENESKVYFLVEVLESHFIPDIRMYQLGSFTKYTCIAYDDLICYHPMQPYRYKMNLYVKLRYGLVCKEMSFSA